MLAGDDEKTAIGCAETRDGNLLWTSVTNKE